MRVLVLSQQARYERFAPDLPAYRDAELIFCDREGTEEEWLAAGADAEALFVTPVTPITESLISHMPNLKMIHCEGVGYDRIDLEAARKRGIYVCNNAGCNAAAVAEISVMMMVMLLRRTIWGDHLVKEGSQAEAVRELERVPTMDLGMATVGLIGFGAIAQATAKLLQAFGSRVYYYARSRRPPEIEAEFGVEYLPLEELAERSDIVSLHLPATKESVHMLDHAFFARMKPGAFLVNTARGAIIDDAALCEAIRSGHLAGAALDAYVPEPVLADHPLVKLAEEYPDRLVLCPHQGGISQGSFQNVYRMLFDNLGRLMAGERPLRIVNEL